MRKAVDNRFNIAYDLAVIEAMADEITDYLLSDQLYWQLSPAARISPPPPMLTIGGYLLRAHRLRGQWSSLNKTQQAKLDSVEGQFQASVQQWTVHSEKRAHKELKARLNSWAWFVEDCQKRKQDSIKYYATEAELRTLIHLLLEFADKLGDVSQHRRKLQDLDSQFRPWFKSGDFVWRSSLEAVYPKDPFWWLYGRPEFPSQS
jgi:hypothetical protein